jgi:lipoprotein-anchoring transpeptidase ErfK/SrfK
MTNRSTISRRDFLKLSSLSLFGLVKYPFRQFKEQDSGLQGRVIYDEIKVYPTPSASGDVVRIFWKDSIIPITGITIGDDEPTYNRVWYRIGGDGYTHSGAIQPVRTVLNQPVATIPRGGMLAEVTVPYTDARREPNERKPVVYRFYYETTHWVVDLVNANGIPWYRVLDDKWELVFYVPAKHLRLVPDSELTTLSPDVPPEEKRLEVRTAEQLVIAYEYGRPVFMARTATGAEFSNGKFFTQPGRYMTFHKRPSRHMAAGNLAYNGFDLPGVPWVSYITERGVAFHGTYWHNDYGRPRSHGCINLSAQASKWIYLWTLPAVPPEEQLIYEKVGTIVDVI